MFLSRKWTVLSQKFRYSNSKLFAEFLNTETRFLEVLEVVFLKLLKISFLWYEGLFIVIFWFAVGKISICAYLN